MLFKQTQQQGLQTFDFCVVNVNDEDTKIRLKRKVNVLKLKMADMPNCIFVILLNQDSFESDCPEIKFQIKTS